MTHFAPALAAGIFSTLKQFVTAIKLYPILVTPFIAITGWLFWMPDDNDAPPQSH